MAWYLKGESGASLDEQMRELSDLSIDSCTLKFSSLADDLLTWSAATQDATGAGTIVPDAGQIVELYEGTNRKFRGYVMAPKVGSKRIKISVTGAWWWMTRIPLTSNQVDASSTTAERANYVFESGSHKTKLEALIARAIVNGVPMIAGTVSDIYGTPKMSIAEKNCGQALAELLAWVPDAVVWFDYSGESGTDPIINIGRRGDFSETIYTLGRDAVIDQDITPRLDLEVAQVNLDYVSRNPTTGLPSWAAQTAGTFVRGKKQIVTVSGPEIVESLPRDDYASYAIQTATPSGTPLDDYILAKDPEFAAAKITYGVGSFGVVVGAGTYEVKTNYVYASGWAASPALSVTARPFVVTDVVTGATVSTAGKTFVKTADIPEWVRRELGYTFQDVNLVGDLVFLFTKNFNLGTSFPSPPDEPEPAWAADITWRTTLTGGVGTGTRAEYKYFLHAFSVSGILVNSTLWASLTTIYRPWAYDYLSPPSDLAEGLRLAQNWVPWEGPITLVNDVVTGNNLLNAKYNLVGTLAACATMATLARNVTHDIFSGRTTIDLGAPARADFGTLTSRIRRQPRDNIVNL